METEGIKVVVLKDFFIIGGIMGININLLLAKHARQCQDEGIAELRRPCPGALGKIL
jgi:hypothetical protein